jgi:hypothetical protein
MRGIRLDFSSSSGAYLDLGGVVEGFETIVQNAMVEVGQKSGSDIIYLEKGNQLQNKAASGGVSTFERLGSEVNLMSIQITDFLNDTDDIDNEDKLMRLSLTVSEMDVDKARLKVEALSTNGQQIGLEATL